MSAFGLTGGIGSGKSAAAERLVVRGAAVVDADATVKRLQVAGSPVFDALVSHFGEKVVGVDGELNRPALAAIVFNDPDELKMINKIVHPAVRVDMAEQRKRLAATHDIIVLDTPLLFEGVTDGLVGIVVVDVPTELAIERLIRYRGFDEADARARIASQDTREERLAKADFVIDNSGDLAHLEAQVERCWSWMQERHHTLGGEQREPSPTPAETGGAEDS